MNKLKMIKTRKYNEMLAEREYVLDMERKTIDVAYNTFEKHSNEIHDESTITTTEASN